MATTANIEILHGFLEESNDSLRGIENAFIRLEKDPANMEIIDEIFRPVHSLKGNSGFFDLTNINKFSHRMENLLDHIRNDKFSVNKEIIDILLTGIDFLRKMLDRAFTDPADVSLRPEEEEFLLNKVDACQPEVTLGTLQSVIDLQQLLEQAADVNIDLKQNSLITKILDHVEKFNDDIRSLIREQNATTSDSICLDNTHYLYKNKDYTQHIKQLDHLLKQLSTKASIKEEMLLNCKSSVAELENVLKEEKGIGKVFRALYAMIDFFDDDILRTSAEFYNDIKQLFQDIIFRFKTKPATTVQRIGEILIDQKKITPNQLSNALNQQPQVGEILASQGVATAKDIEDALKVQNKQILSTSQHYKSPREGTKTIRIDQFKIDEFANSVGELFINLDALNFLKNQLEAETVSFEILSRFAGTISSIDDRVTKLQENIMDIRKVSINTLFQRFPRIIRQLANNLSKNIDFKIIGEHTVIDKDLIEKIENPLVHILRNSVDHGIELPSKRAQQGKPEQGRLELEARVDEYYVHLIIRDDGRGIDPQKMKEIALKKGYMTPTDIAQLTNEDLVNLIFKPGFSSAEKITDISGRGVGMDVVMSSLKECNGTIDVKSTVDKGTTVNIKIPLTKTLVTKDALIVESTGQLFAIPSDEITTTLYADIQFSSILAKEKILSYENTPYSIIDLGHFFYSLQNSFESNDNDQVLVVCDNHKSALLVDKMFNHQKIVVKNFTKSMQRFGSIPGINGYTLLGNEDIVLIVDVARVIQHYSYA